MWAWCLMLWGSHNGNRSGGGEEMGVTLPSMCEYINSDGHGFDFGCT